MTLRDVRRHIGQFAIAGFDGHTVPSSLREVARTFDLGGVILFARNVSLPDQVHELAREAASLADELPLWISVDQEGGRVARLREPFTRWPPMMTLGRSGDEQLACRFGRALAAELTAAGINYDYAPVLDVHTNPRNPVIGDRALSDRAEHVARLGSAIVRALQDNGVAACGKHFPGHGDTSVDSHVELPLVEHAPDRLQAVELVPFRAAIAAGVASIMTAHVMVPALDDERPATLSPGTVSGLLRRELGFDGLIVSDDLDMKAISGRYGLGEAAVMAVSAGCDVVLFCGTDADRQVAALEALIHAVEDHAIPMNQIEEAMKRQRLVKERFLAGRRPAPPPLTLIGCDEHQAIAAEMANFL